jgi:hypothetical protein
MMPMFPPQERPTARTHGPMTGVRLSATELPLRAPLWLGAVPLLIGIGIFIAWVVTGWQGWMLVGVGMLLAGLVSVVSGLVLLARRFILTTRYVLVAVVLVINFPVAAGIVWTTFCIMTEYRIVVRNLAPAPIQNAAITVTSTSTSIPIGRIEPGASVTQWLAAEGDGDLALTGQLMGRPLQSEGDSYVTNSGGGLKRIEVGSDAVARIKESQGYR